MSKEKTSHDAIIIINEKKREVAIFLSITLVVLIVLLVFPIRLMSLKVIQINNEIEGKKRIKEQLDTKINNFTQLNSEYQEMREDFEDFTLIFPNKGDYSLFVANLDEVCNANYFRLRSVNIDYERVRGEQNLFQSLNYWKVNINVAGRRSDLVNLLEDIERLPMYPTVTSFGFNDKLDSDGFLSFNLSVRLYGVNKPRMYLNI